MSDDGGDVVTFYATLWYGGLRDYMPAVPVMLPASSWARGNLCPPRLPPHVTDTAADCGGFVATMRWGDYRYTPAQYVDWLCSWKPRWAATMDYCCEDEVTSGKAGVVRKRQDRTTEMAYHFWQTYRATPWAWVPTVQGWTVRDYQRHARELAPLISEMLAHYGPESAYRVGIGTLCRRASAALIREVVSAVAAELPGVPLHLWGVKLGYVKDRIALPDQVASVDSAAWQGMFATGREAWKQSGMSQAEYGLRVALPAYLDKFEAAAGGVKQLTLL